MTKQEVDALYTFCCFGGCCDSCPFIENGERCTLTDMFYKEQYKEIVKIVNANPKYKRRQIFTNGAEWEIIKRFLTGVRLM